MLKIVDLEKRYNNSMVALHGINLEVQSGEVIGLIGPSGAGKSTLIRCVNRLVEPTKGSISLLDNDLCKLSKNSLRLARRWSCFWWSCQRRKYGCTQSNLRWWGLDDDQQETRLSKQNRQRWWRTKRRWRLIPGVKICYWSSLNHSRLLCKTPLLY